MDERARILVVDDEPDLLHLAAQLLDRAGYEVMGASTGEEAWRLVQDRRPDLVLIDVLLPDLDGVQLCKRIKEDPRLAGIAVVLTSAFRTTSTNQAAGLEAGADGYIARPITNRELLARVRSVLRIRRTERELEATHLLVDTVLEHTYVLVAVLDPQFNFVRVNRAYAEADQREPAFFPGKNHFDLYPNAENQRLFQRVVETGEPYYAHARAFEYAEHPERGVSYWDWSLVPIKNEHGPVRGLVLTLADVTEQVHAQQALREQTHKLNQRVKELNCLFEISRMVEKSGISLPEILQGTVELLPLAWQYPEVACARIVLGEQTFETANYCADAAWRQTADLFVRGQREGATEVCYLEERPDSDEGPFLNEERGLLDAVAERLGRIIERNRAGEELAWNKIILSTISDPISYLDRRYVYRSVNDAYTRYAKMPREEIVGRSVADLLGQEAFAEHVKPHLDRCLAGEEVHYQAWFDVPGEEPKYMDVGYYPVYDESRAIVGAVANSRDITDRKRAEDALQRERDLVTRIMESSPVGIVVLDRGGRIAFANAQVQQVTGLSREQIRRLPYDDPTWRVVDERGKPVPDSLLPFPQVMRSGEPIYDLRHTVELPGGHKLLLSMNAVALLDAKGETDGVVISVEDVTERVRLQEQVRRHAAELEQRVAERTAELRASQAALLQAERLTIVGKVAASLTHEISNPLQSVIGCLGLAEEALAEGGDVGPYIEVALPELRRVARIVARLRNLGRPPSTLAAREPTDINALLQEVLILNRKELQEQGIAIDWQADPDLPLLSLVPDQIQQAFLNIVLNAIDAMRGGGRLAIQTSLTQEPKGLRISFEDDGPGIAPDDLSRIFTPFYSTKPEGLGLGLSISQDIAAQHGGHIEVKSQLGEGTQFAVWLPV